jgi:elongation factor G
VAFVTAGRKAFLDAFNKAKPVVLEPIVEVHVSAPNGSVGDVTADLSGKRGRISNTEALDGNQTVISCQVPLSEIDGYQSRLKSLTGGAGSFSMTFSHYEPVPARTQKQLMDEYRPPVEEG